MVDMSDMPQEVRDAVDREAIRCVLHRYSHGVDRADLETLKSVYWPDGTDDHGTFNGNAWEFAEYLIPAISKMEMTLHTVSNINIELDGDKAKVEAYCVAYHRLGGEDGKTEMVVGGRYLDRFEKRDGEWRIAYRLYCMDWNRNVPSTDGGDEGIYAGLQTRGARFPNDPWNSLKEG